jgi:hypothetical protein
VVCALLAGIVPVLNALLDGGLLANTAHADPVDCDQVTAFGKQWDIIGYTDYAGNGDVGGVNGPDGTVTLLYAASNGNSDPDNDQTVFNDSFTTDTNRYERTLSTYSIPSTLLSAVNSQFGAYSDSTSTVELGSKLSESADGALASDIEMRSLSAVTTSRTTSTDPSARLDAIRRDSASPLEDQAFWPLSEVEAFTVKDSNPDALAWDMPEGQGMDVYWLRSPGITTVDLQGNPVDYAQIVSTSSGVASINSNGTATNVNKLGVRPAMYLKADSEVFDDYASCGLPQSADTFEFTVNFTSTTVAQNFYIPANGRSTEPSTYNAPYNWIIQHWDGSNWISISCSSTLNNTTARGCGIGGAFTGTSTNSSTAGPSLGKPSTDWGSVISPGETRMRLVWAGIGDSTGWLRAFATGYNTSDIHQSAPRITKVGDIPFIGIKQSGSASTTTGRGVAYAMFKGASALTKVGSVLHVDNPSWSAVTITGVEFFIETFSGATSLTTIADGSFHLNNIVTTNNYLFRGVFENAKSLVTLPAGSFNISAMNKAGSVFFATAFYNASSLKTLPDGSFNTSNITQHDGSFFAECFRGASKLESLPAGSFRLSTSQTAVTNKFFDGIFRGANALSALPEFSFNTGHIVSAGTEFFNYAFEGTSSLIQLPTGSFNLGSLTSTGNNAFRYAFQNSALASLPDGSFNTGAITTPNNQFFQRAFYNVASLSALPTGSFDFSGITTFPQSFLSSTFAGETATKAPKLDRATVLGIALKWNATASSLQSGTQGFMGTFQNVSTATGRVFLTDLALLGLDPGSTMRGTFTGTGLCTDSTNYDKWGLAECQNFEFTVKVTDVSANLIVPANGWAKTSGTQPGDVPYDWRVDWKDVGGVWRTVACKSSLNNVSGIRECSGTSYRGVSRNGNTEGPQLGAPNAWANPVTGTGEVTLRLVNTAVSDVGWLRAFATVSTLSMSDVKVDNPHQTASMITAIGDLPFIGIKNDTVDETKVGTHPAAYAMFAMTPNLTSVGSVLSASDPDWMKITNAGPEFFSYTFSDSEFSALPAGSLHTGNITIAGENFFAHAFEKNAALTGLPAGSFVFNSSLGSLAGAGKVGSSFFLNAFSSDTSLASLPVGSFGTDNLATVGSNFFAYAFQGTKLVGLPEQSFNLSSITTAGDSFFSTAFSNVPTLKSLPNGSFNISSIQTVGTYFFANTFYGDTALEALPVGSFHLNGSLTTAKTYFFNGTFNDAQALTSLPDGSFNLDGITDANALNVFADAFRGAVLLQSLPEGSFNTKNIVDAGNSFFARTFMNAKKLGELPKNVFDLSGMTGGADNTVGESFFYATFYGAAEAVLPDEADSETLNSFKLNAGLKYTSVHFFNSTFYNAHKFTTIYDGSFDVSHITSPGANFFPQTFSGESANKAPQLDRDIVSKLVQYWNVSETALQTTNSVFFQTFMNVDTASGALKITDHPQLVLDPNTARKTFDNTNLCTDSDYFENWGLSRCVPPGPVTALPFTGSSAVWWWILLAAVLVLSVPAMLARGRVLGGFAVGQALSGASGGAAGSTGWRGGRSGGPRLRLSPHEIPHRRGKR